MKRSVRNLATAFLTGSVGRFTAFSFDVLELGGRHLLSKLRASATTRAEP